MKRIAFTAQARADVRRLDVPTALRIFAGLHRFAETGVGDVKKLEGEPTRWRIRVSDWRVIFAIDDGERVVDIIYIRHRSKAYE